METTYLVAKGILKPWLATWFRWHVEGLDHLPRRGPAIVAFNHIAYLDPLVAAYVIDEAGRVPRFLAKAELFRDRRIAWVLRGAKQIEVRRGTPEAPMALDRAVDALARGEVVVIFPEGTITHDPDLRPMAARSGLARLALSCEAPVVPGAIWGTHNVWPKDARARWMPRQDILVRIGEAFRVTGDPDSPRDWKAVGEEVMAAIASLTASLRPAVPDRRRTRSPAA
ncbi:MAG: lysophospholipid acyltransferase family protein [Actinomycetota bacterium]